LVDMKSSALGAGPPRQREKRDPAATRQALLRAGAELFAERGFDGVSTEDIAERAGVNKALISYHFRGKRGLYVAILRSTFAAMAERLAAIEASAPGAREALRAILEVFRDMTQERHGFPTLFLREVLSTGIEPALLPYLVEIIGVSRRLAERGARERVFRRVDPLLLHFGLVGGLVFFFATEPARRRAAADRHLPFPMPDSVAFVDYLEQLTLRGLAPEAPAGRRPGLASSVPSRLRRKGARA
jgi:AcrR family transcriptional regulator